MQPARTRSGRGRSVGIDLGTTYSAVAHVDEFGKAVVLPNREGEHLTPSVVLFDGEQPIVGAMAKRSVVAAPLDVVQFVKRSMGDPSWRFDTAAGSTYRPEEISALILRRLVDDAERALGAEVTDAVITVPAYFDDAPRRATIDAGTIAGLTVRRVLNEPTAAALAYGIDGSADGVVLVYDLGGGTFDVTAMRIRAGEFEVLATHGDRNLGGFDFDNLLMQLLNERFVAAGGPSLLEDDVAEADLREKAEIAKHSLTSVERTTVTLTADGCTASVAVTRSEFDDLCTGLLGRTRDIVDIVLDDAGLRWDRVDRVLLAGGATRMPMVRGLLDRLSGGRVDASPNPDEIVARGAAIQAALLEDDDARAPLSRVAAAESEASEGSEPRTPTGMRRVRVRDVTSHGLGEILYRGSTDQAFNKVVIPANSPIPARGSSIAHTREVGQTTLRTRITQGDDEDPDFVRVVGEQAFPIPSYDRSAPFETTLIYDEDQTIWVDIKDLTSGRHVGTFSVENVANMAPADVEQAADRVRRTRVE